MFFYKLVKLYKQFNNYFTSFNIKKLQGSFPFTILIMFILYQIRGQ